MALDYLIRGATIVDGTGAPGVVGDVAVEDGRIAAVGKVDEGAGRILNGDGLVVAPGFVDPHTHYDAQFFWDPQATPSNVHGVTTAINGNCGFTLAPIKAEDADYIRRMMMKVEGMPLAALEQGVPWTWETFGEYLAALDGKLAVNAGFMVGHCALRRYVMGADAIGNQASQAQVDEMVRVLHDSLTAGGFGFSTTLSATHTDGDGKPVASRHASRDELLALCGAVQEHEGTTLEGIVEGCLDMFSDDEIALLTDMSVAARRAINWNVLTVDSRVPQRITRQLEASDAARKAGGRVIALTMPVLVPMNMSFGTYCAFNLMPGWGDVLNLPLPERMTKLRDPEVRRTMLGRATSEEAGVFRRLADFGKYVLGDTYSAANEGLKGRVVEELAKERGQEPFDALVDIVLNDDLRTVLWPMPPDNDDATWKLRQEVWQHPDVLLGGSDAGAHLDRMCGAPYTTEFLADCIRGRRLASIERAIHLMTDVPARFFGLRDRGRVAEGWFADLVVFDPATVGAGDIVMRADLPGGCGRLYADSVGIEHVFVNGRRIVADGVTTGDLPGTVLRSGRHTDTVLIPAASSI